MSYKFNFDPKTTGRPSPMKISSGEKSNDKSRDNSRDNSRDKSKAKSQNQTRNQTRSQTNQSSIISRRRALQFPFMLAPINPVNFYGVGPLGSMRMAGGGNNKPGLIPKTNVSNALTIATRKCCRNDCSELDGPKLFHGAPTNWADNEIFGYWSNTYFANGTEPFGKIDAKETKCALASPNHDNTVLFLFYPPTVTYTAGGFVALVIKGEESTHGTWTRIRAINTETKAETYLRRDQCRSYPSVPQPDGVILTLYYWWAPGGVAEPPYYDDTVINKNTTMVYFFE